MSLSIEIKSTDKVLGFKVWEVLKIFRDHERQAIKEVRPIYKGLSFKNALAVARLQRTEFNNIKLIIRG